MNVCLCVISDTHGTHGTHGRTRANGSHGRTSQPSTQTQRHKPARKPRPTQQPQEQPQARSRPLPAADSPVKRHRGGAGTHTRQTPITSGRKHGIPLHGLSVAVETTTLLPHRQFGYCRFSGAPPLKSRDPRDCPESYSMRQLASRSALRCASTHDFAWLQRGNWGHCRSARPARADFAPLRASPLAAWRLGPLRRRVAPWHQARGSRGAALCDSTPCDVTPPLKR